MREAICLFGSVPIVEISSEAVVFSSSLRIEVSINAIVRLEEPSVLIISHACSAVQMFALIADVVPSLYIFAVPVCSLICP